MVQPINELLTVSLICDCSACTEGREFGDTAGGREECVRGGAAPCPLYVSMCGGMVIIWGFLVDCVGQEMRFYYRTPFSCEGP